MRHGQAHETLLLLLLRMRRRRSQRQSAGSQLMSYLLLLHGTHAHVVEAIRRRLKLLLWLLLSL